VVFRYKAFLSYSHKDQKAAMRFHRALENYRLPKHFAGNNPSADAHNDRLGRIFRDRDELPAAEDLTAEVKKALESSEFMIVLCSPRAAASRWVNKEIIEFKKLRGEAFVLPVILEGEPGASAEDQNTAANECFPPAVRFKLDANGQLSRRLAEPIAADMRKSADGRQNALLKVIAGLLGIGLDQLIERELRRKQRRVIAVTVASLLATLVMGVLTRQAITARHDADQNRAQAEDLVEFMLTDLREKLDAVGRLDVLDSVGAKAVSYYDAQSVDKLGEGSIGRRARAFHLLGEVEELRGDMDDAQAMFDRAAGSTAALLARSPDDPQRIFDHSQSVFWSGYMDIRRGNFATALSSMRLYKVYAEQLVAIAPKNPEWQMELSYAYSNIGTLQLLNMHQPREAFANYSAAVDILKDLIAANPNDPTLLLNLADMFAWSGDALRNFGLASKTMAARAKQQKILEGFLTLNPRHKDALRQLSICFAAQGWIAFYQQDPAAGGYFEKAEEILDTLAESDPENRAWQRLQSDNQLRLARVNMVYGQLENADAAFEQSGHLPVPQIVENEANIGDRIFWGLHRPYIELKLQAFKKGFTAVKNDAVLLLKVATSDSLDVTQHEHGRRAVADIYMLAIRSLLAAGDNAKAQRLLSSLWAGETILGPLKFGAEQDPIWVNIVAEIAFLRGDTTLLTKLKNDYEKRGYKLTF